MEADERASLNRRAAELAGWRFEATPSPGITLVISPEGWETMKDMAEDLAPDFLGDPSRWWPLVERFAGLAEERDTQEGGLYYWYGPIRRDGQWCVEAQVIGFEHMELFADTAGACVVRACLAVAAVLGLGAGKEQD